MRIKKLYIQDFKKFSPFIELDFSSEINLLIGLNGSGKSSIFEAIASIFTRVKTYCIDGKRREREFDFKIDYTFYSNTIVSETTTTQESIGSLDLIELTSSSEGGLVFTMAKNGEYIKDRGEMLKYLPDNIFFYYAGFSQGLKHIVSPIEKEQAKSFYKIKDNDVSKVSQIFQNQITYIKESHFPILFLIDYLKSQKSELPLSNEKYSVSNISLILKKPDDFSNNKVKDLYLLDGLLRKYLDELLRNTFSGGVEFDEEEKKPFIPIETHQSLITSLYEIGNWENNYIYENDAYLLFHFFNLLLDIGILEEARVYIKKGDDSVSFSVNDLSEGEQQLITISTLRKHLLKGNSVLVLDEPDAFLHPKRQRELIPFLSNLFNENNTQILLATHSPNLINNAKSSNISINILDNNKVTRIENNFYGKSISAINYKLMNVTERPKEIQDFLNTLFIQLEEENIKEAKVIYTKLLDILGDDDIDLIQAKIELDFLISEQND